MWRNYLRIAARTLFKERLYAGINIVGLAVGLACCLLLGLYVRDELQYDRFHEMADRLYRVTMEAEVRDEAWGTTSPPLGPTIEGHVPGVEATVRWWSSRHVIRCGERSRTEVVHFADPAFFNVFSFPLRSGDPATALDDPGDLVLTKRMADRCFGTAQAQGNTVQVMLDSAFVPMTVSGIAEDPPHSSSLQFDAVLPFSRVEDVRGTRYVENWGNLSTTTFVLLQENASPAATASVLTDAANRHYGADLIDFVTKGGDRIPHRLQSITDIHLTPSVGAGRGLQSPNTPLYAAILGGLALLILVVACINFANLSIGRSLRRTAEIGVRKAMGAHRSQLAVQFLTEALLAGGIAVVLGLGLAVLALPTFNSLVDKTLQLSLADASFLAGTAMGLTLLTGLLAGGYPALILSRFEPAEGLRRRARLGTSGGWTKGLVVAQFALAIVLAAGALGMRSQLSYVQQKDLGYNTEGLVSIDLHGDGVRTADRLRQTLREDPVVRSVAVAEDGLSKTPVTVGERSFDTYHHWVSDDYRSTLGLPLTAGRFFTPNRSNPTGQSVVVNEAFVEQAGLQDPLGRTLTLFDGEWQPTIVGVVEDFHFQSLHQPVRPMVLHQAPHGDPEQVWVRMAPDQISAGLGALEAAWQRAAPMQPFSYQFEAEALEQQYRDDRRWQQIVGWAALFALIVAALGLFGLATLAVAQRTKEIGIRKAVGATAANIVGLLTKDFAVLVLGAMVVAVPAAYVGLERWLVTFAYHVELGPMVFLLAGGGALLVAVLTVAVHAFRAARFDPATVLRSD